MPKRKAQRAPPDQGDPIRSYAMWADRTGRAQVTPLEWQRQAVSEPFYVHLPPPLGLGLKRVQARPPEREGPAGGVVIRRTP